MIMTRKLKVRCENKEFYKFLKQETREQSKALNIAIGMIHTQALLKDNGTGKETKITNSIKKLESKINKLKEELENPKITDKKKEQTEKAIKTNISILEGEQNILNDTAKYKNNFDEQFSELFLNNNNLYHYIKDKTQIQYMRTIDLVKRKVKEDYSNNFVELVTGNMSLMNYKNTFPLMIDKMSISLIKEDENFKIKIMNGYELDIILGQRVNENILELRRTLDKCIIGEYKICQSKIKIDNNDVIFILTMDIPDIKKYTPIKDRTIGVDLGLKVPVYMCVSDNAYKRKALGDINNFLRVRKQIQARKRKAQKDVAFANGGKGKTKKTQYINKLRENEKNFCTTYNHKLSKEIVNFAKQHKAEYINFEALTKDGFDNSILRNWSYYQLQQFTEYKAKRLGIKIRYVDPSYTSQTCSKCGAVHKENRRTRDKFKCINPECRLELNADHNAAINIARRTI